MNGREKWLLGVLIVLFPICFGVMAFTDSVPKESILIVKILLVITFFILGLMTAKNINSRLTGIFLSLIIVIFNGLIPLKIDDLVDDTIKMCLNIFALGLLSSSLISQYSDSRTELSPETDENLRKLLRSIRFLFTRKLGFLIIGGMLGGFAKVFFDLDNQIFQGMRGGLICKNFFESNVKYIFWNVQNSSCPIAIVHSFVIYGVLGFVGAMIGIQIINNSLVKGNRNKIIAYALAFGFASSLVLSRVNEIVYLSDKGRETEAVQQVKDEAAQTQNIINDLTIARKGLVDKIDELNKLSSDEKMTDRDKGKKSEIHNFIRNTLLATITERASKINDPSQLKTTIETVGKIATINSNFQEYDTQKKAAGTIFDIVKNPQDQSLFITGFYHILDIFYPSNKMEGSEIDFDLADYTLTLLQQLADKINMASGNERLFVDNKKAIKDRLGFIEDSANKNLKKDDKKASDEQKAIIINRINTLRSQLGLNNSSILPSPSSSPYK